MRTMDSMRSGEMVARSLKITRATHTLVAAVTAAVALNTMVAIQSLGVAGQAVLLAIVFLSLGLGSYAVSTDVYSRSGQAIANLRSIGASRGSISSALALAIVGYGVVGAALGAVVGALLSLALGSGGAGGVSMLIQSAGVIAAASAATAAGFYAGVRSSWRS